MSPSKRWSYMAGAFQSMNGNMPYGSALFPMFALSMSTWQYPLARSSLENQLFADNVAARCCLRAHTQHLKAPA